MHNTCLPVTVRASFYTNNLEKVKITNILEFQKKFQQFSAFLDMCFSYEEALRTIQKPFSLQINEQC